MLGLKCFDLTKIQQYQIKLYRMQDPTAIPKVLILGGTNFMGKTLITMLSQNLPELQIHCINRGKTYWNNAVYKQNPKIIHHYGDRRQSKQMGKMIDYIHSKVCIDQNHQWKAVIDFSSFRWREIQSIAKGLKSKTELYVFISSDSLYNNSPFDGNAIREENFDPQSEYRKLKGKKKEDKYGYNKLKCQLYLQRTKHLPFVALRLPDVLGPYQNTSRYWCTLEWIKRSDKYPMELSEKDKKCPLSLVFSRDVAKQIQTLIERRTEVEKYRSYNLSLDENPTYEELVEKMAEHMNPYTKPKFTEIQEGQTIGTESNGMFPSTYTYICNELAKKCIDWAPSKFDQCIKQTNEFFTTEALNYPAEKKEMFRQFKRVVIDRD